MSEITWWWASDKLKVDVRCDVEDNMSEQCVMCIGGVMKHVRCNLMVMVVMNDFVCAATGWYTWTFSGFWCQ